MFVLFPFSRRHLISLLYSLVWTQVILSLSRINLLQLYVSCIMSKEDAVFSYHVVLARTTLRQLTFLYTFARERSFLFFSLGKKVVPFSKINVRLPHKISPFYTCKLRELSEGVAGNCLEVCMICQIYRAPSPRSFPQCRQN